MSRVRLGVEVLLEERRDLLRGRRLGLITNHTGRDRQGRSTIELLHGRREWRLASLFAPEHGLRGEAAAGEPVPSSLEPRTGLPVFSLYGDTRRPTRDMLAEVDLLVYDVQDVGARPFTYISTLLEAMRACASYGISLVVLDRPDPINGVDVEGAVLDDRFASFVGPAPLPMRYGMTVGELARFFNEDCGVRAELTVVPMRGWARANWYDETGLPWISPSPNMRTLATASLFPGTVLLERTTLSEGRGTERPFEQAGAPWLDGARWASRLTELAPPGVRIRSTRFTPTTSKYAAQRCEGVRLEIVDRARLRPMELGLYLLASVRELGGERFEFTAGFDRLCGTDRIRIGLEEADPVSAIVRGWQGDLAAFVTRRSRYLLY